MGRPPSAVDIRKLPDTTSCAGFVALVFLGVASLIKGSCGTEDMWGVHTHTPNLAGGRLPSGHTVSDSQFWGWLGLETKGVLCEDQALTR